MFYSQISELSHYNKRGLYNQETPEVVEPYYSKNKEYVVMSNGFHANNHSREMLNQPLHVTNTLNASI